MTDNTETAKSDLPPTAPHNHPVSVFDIPRIVAQLIERIQELEKRILAHESAPTEARPENDLASISQKLAEHEHVITRYFRGEIEALRSSATGAAAS